jgi:hypothetical protein
MLGITYEKNSPTMSEQRTRDHIDLELSRTYFGSAAAKKEPPIPEKPKQEEIIGKEKQKPSRPVRHSSPVLKFLLVLWILSIVIFAAGYFLRDNRISFSLNINVEPRQEEIKQPVAAEKTTPAITERIAKFLDNAKTKIISAVATSSAAKPEKISAPKPTRNVVIEKDARILYNFAHNENGWEIPMWALDKTDHVARNLKRTSTVGSSGNSSLEFDVEFPGGGWNAALVQVEQYLDFTGYDEIRTDIYIPPECPQGLRCKLILTVGENWKFIEMSRGTRLKPGEWTTVKASIEEGSNDWRRTVVDEDFKSDIRKIAVRVESNGKQIYSGPIYLDNIRLIQKEQASTNISPSL